MINRDFLRELRQASIRRNAEWPGATQLGMDFRLVEMAGESGELLNAVKKWYRASTGVRGNDGSQLASIKENLKEELADVIITVDLIGMAADVDFSPSITFVHDSASPDVVLRQAVSIIGAVGRLADTSDIESSAYSAVIVSRGNLLIEKVARLSYLLFNEPLELLVRNKFNATSKKIGLSTRL